MPHPYTGIGGPSICIKIIKIKFRDAPALQSGGSITYPPPQKAPLVRAGMNAKNVIQTLLER